MQNIIPRSGLIALIALAGCYEGAEEQPQLRGFEVAFPDEDSEPGEGLFEVGEEFASLEYSVRGGYAVHQGDIILSEEDSLQPWQRGDTSVQPSATLGKPTWEGGVIPYDVSTADAESVEAFLAGAAMWEAVSGLKFVPRTGESNYLVLVNEPGCWSYVGRMAAPQKLSLGTGCKSPGTAAHELGHAAGLWHEQSRTDRDEHIVINWANIPPDKRHNFETYLEAGHSGEDVAFYDPESIMHYSSYAFAIDDTVPTITRLDGSELPGNRDDLSESDVLGMQSMYGTKFAVRDCAVVLRPDEVLRRGENFTSCDGRFLLSMQGDGNLVLYTSDYKALWNSQTAGSDGELLAMQTDGNLVLYDADWNAEWNSETQAAQVSLVLQDDGNLVLYTSDGKPVWHTQTYGN